MSGLWRGWTTAVIIGATNSNAQPPLHQHRPRLPMADEKEVRPHRAPYKSQESAAVPKRTQRARRREIDRCYQPTHRPRLPMALTISLRPRRAPVKYHECDDDERAPRRAAPSTQRAPRVEDDRRDPATPQTPRAAADRRYRETHRAQRAEADRRYRQQHLERIREKDREYYKTNRERIRARQQRYRESHREAVRENQQRYRESRREEVREKQRRYRESRGEEFREKQRQRYARRRKTHPELVREQNRIRSARYRAKKRIKKKLTTPLTIPLTDCRRSARDYVQTFCDSLDSGDTPLPESQDSGVTNVPLPESFLQLLNEDSHTVLDLDSGVLQVSEPSDCNDLSFLQDLLAPDEWEQVMDDVQDFDVDDWMEDMTSSDEGVDLIYDLVS